MYTARLRLSHAHAPGGPAQAAVELLADPVANVRLRACMLLPNLKRTVRMPEDAALLEHMSKLCTTLNADSDRDVGLTARTVIDRFKVVPTHGSGQKDPTMSTAQAAEADASDAQKERQENELIAAEDAAMKHRCARPPSLFPVRC